METASRYGSKPNVYSAPMAEDVHMEVKMEGEGPRMGADAQLSILVKNLSLQPRRTTLHSQVAVMYYTGVLKGTIKKEQMSVELLPNEGWLSIELYGYNNECFNTNTGLTCHRTHHSLVESAAHTRAKIMHLKLIDKDRTVKMTFISCRLCWCSTY